MSMMADKLGVSEAHISLVENGRRNPSPNLLGRWLGILSPDKEFKLRTMSKAAKRDIGRAQYGNIYYLAGYALEQLHAGKRADNQEEDGVESREQKLIEAVARMGMEPDDFAVVVKCMLRDRPYRDLIIALARMPEGERRRYVEAFKKLLPRNQKDDQPVDHESE